MYILVFSDKFQKQLKKLTKSNPSLKLQTLKAVKMLAVNPNHTSLRLHKIVGEDYWSISVNKSIRVLIKILGDKIFLIRIGTHNVIYDQN